MADLKKQKLGFKQVKIIRLYDIGIKGIKQRWSI